MVPFVALVGLLVGVHVAAQLVSSWPVAVAMLVLSHAAAGYAAYATPYVTWATRVAWVLTAFSLLAHYGVYWDTYGAIMDAAPAQLRAPLLLQVWLLTPALWMIGPVRDSKAAVWVKRRLR